MSDMKPNRPDVAKSVATMAEVIPFFPQSELGLEVVIAQLLDFVGDSQGLEWLTNTAIRVIPKWGGVAGLRGLYCTRYKPCDGLPATASDIPGFTPTEAMDAAEMAYLERESQETDRKLLQWRREALMLKAGNNAPPQLPAPMSITDVPGFQPPPFILRPTPKDIMAARAFDDKLNPKAVSANGECPTDEEIREERRHKTTAELEAELALVPRKHRTPEEQDQILQELQEKLKVG